MTLELSELVSRAAEVVAAVDAGEPVVLTRNGAVAATFQPQTTGNERLIGFARGTVLRVADDFTRPLPDDTWTGSKP